MKSETAIYENPVVLVEGPDSSDAEFFGRWLLEAAKANNLLNEAKDHDPFRQRIETLDQSTENLDFGLMAVVFASQFAETELYTFVLDVYSLDLREFVLMVEMGFFTLTGDRYQMTLPANLNLNTFKQAHLKLVETEDKNWVHPERLVVAISVSQAECYQKLLRDMNQNQRFADRQALLS